MKITQKTSRKVKHITEIIICKRCKKRWEVSWMEVRNEKAIEHEVICACTKVWMEVRNEKAIEHEVICACTKVLKTVKTAPEGPPVMIPQHSKDNTFAACMPAAVAGALYPILSAPILIAVYVLSWVACGATFVNDDNRDASVLVRVAIKSLVFTSFAASVGALLGHALWWWWQ